MVLYSSRALDQSMAATAVSITCTVCVLLMFGKEYRKRGGTTRERFSPVLKPTIYSRKVTNVRIIGLSADGRAVDRATPNFSENNNPFCSPVVGDIMIMLVGSE